jgi:tight adherence protein C
MKIVLALLIAVIVFCGYLLGDRILAAKRQREALSARLSPDGGSRPAESEDFLSSSQNELSARGKTMAALLRGMGVSVDDMVRKLDPRFAQAGIHAADGPIIYLFFQRILSLPLVILALVFLFSHAEGMDRMLNIFIGLIAMVVAFFGPYLYLQNKIDARKKVLQRAFPDTLDLLLICVESGLALDAALNRVCAELGSAYPEITEELNRTRLELALINDRTRALMNLGNRTNMVAFRSLVAALIQSERFGTSLSDTMRVLSEDFRLQRLMDAEAKAARLPVLLTIPLIFLLMPSFMLIVLGPAIVKFAHQGSAVTGQ